MPVIRKATVNDVNAIVNIAHETWWPAYRDILSAEQIEYMLQAIYDVDKLRKQISCGEQQYLILEQNAVPLGFAAYSPREETAEVYKLHKLYCLPSTHGSGFGRQLIEAVIKKVRQAGATALDLNVNRHNQAKAFYEKMGFVVIYEEDVPIGSYWMNDYVMRLELL